MSDVPSEERRRAERVAVNSAFLELANVTCVRDLSVHGVFVLAEDVVAVGTLIDLRFTVLVDDPVVVRARGRVVRHSTDPRGMGIEFTNLSNEMALKIEEVVLRNKPWDSGPPTEPGDAEATKVHETKDVLEAKDVAMAPVVDDDDGNDESVGGDNEDPVEAAQTLVKLKPVNMDILESADDGGEASGTEEDE